MPTPHPTDPTYAQRYSAAWSREDPAELLDFFAADGLYADMAMGATYEGHDRIARFHRFMLTFAPDTLVEFTEVHAADGWLLAEWTWCGSVESPLRLRDGSLVDAAGQRFSVDGVAYCRYEADGRLTSHRDYWDLMTVLHQLQVPIGRREAMSSDR